jgi:tetratricopeptide (TPR) repeat protein
LFSNRSAAFFKIGSNQSAKLDAEQALQFAPNDKKAQFRLASALFHLGSYRNALNVLRPMQSTDNEEIQTLLRHVVVCEEEIALGFTTFRKLKRKHDRIHVFSMPTIAPVQSSFAPVELVALEGEGFSQRQSFHKEPFLSQVKPLLVDLRMNSSHQRPGI